MSTGSFKVVAASGKTKARIGELSTAHGVLETPLFMPVASKAAVKTLLPDEVRELGYDAILSNTYHLYLKPGRDVLRHAGGLHKFMGWDGMILTDSGGYQVFSLSKIFKVTDDGIDFASHIDGSRHFLTPEDVVDIQASDIGSDIAMVLDECPPYPAEKERVRLMMNRTLNWAKRSKKHFNTLNNGSVSGMLLYGIVQGGMYPDLREESAAKTVEIGFDGYGIGGLSVGEPRSEMLEMLSVTLAGLPEDKPRYLMGVGDPDGIADAIKTGVDMFDSALPTRVARNGTAFIEGGRLNILNAANAEDDRPLDPGCGCNTCRNFSRAYLRHAYATRETLALRLLTWHNLYFVHALIEREKAGIKAGG